MRVREISYSKKIGLPNYGSLGLSATAELETNDAFDDAYQGLKAMVDDQIEGSIPINGHSNGNGHTTTQTQPKAQPPTPPLNPDVELATAKQMELIQRLCQEQGRKAPGASLSKAAASNLINNLLEEDKGTTAPHTNGSNDHQSYQSHPRQFASPNGNGNAKSSAKMTEGQRRYLYRLLSDQGYRGKEANEQLKTIFRVETLAQITKAAASSQIEVMVTQVA